MNEIAPRNPAGEFVIAPWQRTDAAIAEHDMIRKQRNIRKYGTQRTENIIALFRDAAHAVDRIDPDVCRAG